MLWRVHEMKKLCLSISGPDIARLITEHHATTAVSTVWRVIQEFEMRGYLVRSNSYRNRKAEDGRPVSFADNFYVLGPRFLEILNSKATEDQITDKIRKQRSLARARFRRMRRGEGVAPARVRLALAEHQSSTELGELAAVFAKNTDWTPEHGAELFERVRAQQERAGERWRSALGEDVPVEAVETPEPEHLLEAAEVSARSGSTLVRRLDLPEVSRGLTREAMVAEPPKDKESGLQGLLGRARKTWGRGSPEAKQASECENAARTCNKNTISLSDGIPKDNGNFKGVLSLTARQTIEKPPPPTPIQTPSRKRSNLNSFAREFTTTDPDPPTSRERKHKGVAGAGDAPSKERASPFTEGLNLLRVAAEMAEQGSEYARFLCTQLKLGTT